MSFKKRTNKNIAASAIVMPLLLGVGCSSKKANNGISEQSTTAAEQKKI